MLPVLGASIALSAATLRPPAVPLIVHDPYFSVWSFNDRLTDGWTRHWTGATMAMCGMVQIDGKPYRFAGSPISEIPTMEQTGLQVRATTTSYQFTGGGIRLHVDFFSPSFADDLDVLSKPVAFVRFQYESEGGAAKQVRVYLDTSAEWCVNRTDQRVTWGRTKIAGGDALRIGTQEQPVLQKRGDDLRIDWGNLIIVPPAGADSVIASDRAARGGFMQSGTLPESDDLGMPRPASDNWPVLASAFDLAAGQTQSVLIAYDDQYSLEWFRRPVQAYWRRTGQSFESMLADARQSEAAWVKKGQEWDARVQKECVAAGGTHFADLANLSYRQALGAHKIVADIDGKPMMFSKENFSNGCIGTVDVLYPAAPIMLAYNPEMLAANLRPLLIYASLPRWKWDFAPHDLGTYPKANGQVYGGGEETEENQMPVEESGNMLILAAAYVDRGGDKTFIREYLPVLDKWANYLLAKGLDPENQLCTDDFAGHLARNANLSLKAIVALGSYAKMLGQLGVNPARAQQVRKEAEAMAAQWQKLAGDGDHFRLAFDRPGTWSQKYNLVWDKVLGLKLFPPSVYDAELKFYASKLGPFGLPLDNRRTYTKLDWCVWTACLSDERAEFDRHIAPLWRMANESPSRVPLTDWFETTDGKQVGFQARSVVGGVFMPLLIGKK